MRLTIPRRFVLSNILRTGSTPARTPLATPTPTPIPTPTPASTPTAAAPTAAPAAPKAPKGPKVPQATESIIIKALPAQASKTQHAYFVARSKSNQIPVYLRVQAGGSKKSTLIRKVQGDVAALRDDVINMLGLEAVVNPVTGHVVVKGCHVARITEWLKERGF